MTLPPVTKAPGAYKAERAGARLASNIDSLFAPKPAPSAQPMQPMAYTPPQLVGPTPEQMQGQRDSELDAIARQLALQEQASQQQMGYGTQQQNYQNALLRNQLLSGAYRQTAEAQSRQASLRPMLGEIDTNLERSLGNMQRQGIFDKANLQDSMIGRGLGQSGVRLGAEGRQQADLVQRQGDTTLAAQQQRAGIERQIEESGRNWLAGQQEIGANIQAIKDQTVPTAPTLDDLIRKYRTGLGAK